MEAEYDEKLRVLQEKHKVELHAASTSDAMTTTTNEHVTTSAASKEHDTTANRSSSSNSKLDKTRKKREKDRDQKREREQRIAEETANAISPRQVEMEQIQQQLEGLHLMIHEVAADGNCLYRAVGAQCGADYVQMRKYDYDGERTAALSAQAQYLSSFTFSIRTQARHVRIC